MTAGAARDVDQRGWWIRPAGAGDFRAVVEVVGEALLSSNGFEASLERQAALRAESGFDRLLVAVETAGPDEDGERVVGRERVIGSADAHPFRMRLPGGVRPVAGVAGVGVWPTRRRRGVLTALMRRQLSDLRDRDEKVAVLWASEGAIYGRFGYAPATEGFEASLSVPRTRLRPDAPRDHALVTELGRVPRARADLERVHAREAARRTGRIGRSSAFWDDLLRDTPDERDGRSALKAVVVSAPEGPQGYALYRTLNKWRDGGAACEVHVRDIVALTPAARTALCAHLLSRDLVERVVFDAVPGDDPLRHLVTDPHRVVTRFDDALWLRLVDLPGALRERSYAAPVDTVLEVGDTHAPWNAGRWRLRADRSGAICERTDASPDLTLDTSPLAAAYLGGHTLTGHLRAGLIAEHTPDAAALLDLALTLPEAPFCDLDF
ncbi:GNAT family N-acetyltransferase [Nocardiopsis sp. MG754419]|uniref:GNAT family N-acetyltransferase n=1 Tax=Nocardiopsis sp. MG754419 TaxID=2259865 RepID=UPI001BA6B0CC|nr:GNAT family N-acetyltransferase [Nocardiopsis sp. MG754419]MBR8743247.1 GNAT family N-acetyltransferase [Nocardiopsis sp. MG754419]